MEGKPPRRKYVQQAFSTIYFRDGVLSLPGYAFEKAAAWEDVGSRTQIAEGSSLKDGSNVLAKIAPAHTPASVCLEREAHILTQIQAHSEMLNCSLRLIDFISVPRGNGDCAVLLLSHPGPNMLGRYLPRAKVNEILLAERPHPRHSAQPTEDIFMSDIDDLSLDSTTDTMDFAMFLEVAIQATNCLEMMHKSGLVHREVRANAFHFSSYSSMVRLVHFGNRSESLERYGGPTSLVLKSGTYDEAEKDKVKEALCYLAPEQTGSIETSTEDHRTDLYALGVFFWTLLVGRGMLPFQGQASEILHSIAQKRAIPVHEIKRNTPQVLSEMIEKMLNKNPDQRYQSASGLKADLLECQIRLYNSVSSNKDHSELIPPFEIATKDRYMVFTIPNALYGREKEQETIRKVIRHSHSHYASGGKNYTLMSSAETPSRTGGTPGSDDNRSNVSSPSGSSVNLPEGASSDSATKQSPNLAPVPETTMVSTVGSPVASMTDGLRRIALQPSQKRSVHAHAVIVVGPAGVGKSSLVLSQQTKWRQTGLFAHAKFQSVVSAPFSTLLSCFSSALRQMMAFPSDLHCFVEALKSRLGLQLRLLPLLYAGAPELQDIMNLFQISIDSPQESLATTELRARFNSLAENVIGALADTRMFALFLDDLHEADDSSLDLINGLVHSKSRILIFATLRDDNPDILERVRAIFAGRSRATWIQLQPLPFSAITTLVSHTLRRTKADVISLSRLIHAVSAGNAFSARNILTRLQRQNLITFDLDQNLWKFDMNKIEASLPVKDTANPNDLSFIVSQLKQLPEEARKYIIWASFFGATFKVTDVALVMERDDLSSGSSGSEVEDDEDWNVKDAATNIKETSNRSSMKGMQVAIAEGWIINRGRDEAAFAHDRYRQAAEAEADIIPKPNLAKMSFRIITVMLHETNPDMFKVAERAQRCLSLLREHPRREELVSLLIDAGQSAFARGAHEIAYQALINARSLLEGELWLNVPRAFSVVSRLAELATWRGSFDESDSFLDECYEHAEDITTQATLLRQRARNQFMRNKFSLALGYTLNALKVLGVELKSNPSMEEADVLFDEVKNELLAVGFDSMLQTPRATDSKIDMAVSLLSDAALHAFWNTGGPFTNMIGLTTIQLALRHGISPGTGLGLFFMLEAAERRQLCRFAVDLGQIAVKLSDSYGGSVEKGRSLVLYSAMVAPYENTHLRANISRLERAAKYCASGGDKSFSAFASLHNVLTKTSLCVHVDELHQAAEESFNDISLWIPKSDGVIFSVSLLCFVRALGGYTIATSAETIFRTDTFDEATYLSSVLDPSSENTFAMNWFNSYKVAALFCLGFASEAAELGFYIYETRHVHPNHRHPRLGLFFHSLALIACVRKHHPESQRYLEHVALNQAYLRNWSSASPVNAGHWVTLVDAELSSLQNGMEALQLYDEAIRLCVNNDWLLEEGWALYLEGEHLVRWGVDGLGGDLMRRGISRQNHWGARGIANNLSSRLEHRHVALKRHIFSASVGVQTDAAPVTVASETELRRYDESVQEAQARQKEDEMAALSASDLSSVLKWSNHIESDIHLSPALQRLTEIVTEQSGAQVGCSVIIGEAGEYNMATSIVAGESCRIYEKPVSIRDIPDPLQRAVLAYALNAKERVHLESVSSDSRFMTEAQQSPCESVICLPIFSNRGQTLGALYLASKSAFPQKTFIVITLLVQQASISIANALSVRSLQYTTRENLKMIRTQREALDRAKKSEDEALKATKVKGSFLAAMSHELRTPFSSFYGLLDILWGTQLNAGQRELVQTAKENCELLLKLIDSILDYSKLEASALKLEYSGFYVEGLLADCIRLLLPTAANNGLELSYDIERNVPAYIEADPARLTQVLMNLIGNAVKFTLFNGSIRVVCSLDQTPSPSVDGTGMVQLKFIIQDTGIGLSPSDVDLLFVPFQQADNSSTRRFGGTGLGLSICRQLVKLMGGVIGVNSELGKGSTFWFTIPVARFESREAQRLMADLSDIRARLLHPRPPKILINSPSDTTLSLLRTMLEGFEVVTATTADELAREIQALGESLSFIILDHQSETHADDIAHQSSRNTKVIHLYTPVAEGATAQVSAEVEPMPGVLRLTKPPRTARILQALARLSNLPSGTYTDIAPEASPTMEDSPVGQRTVYGNILIAEDNDVARRILSRQLEKHDLKVTATADGQEAVATWEKHEPGFFSLAIFDHHMPVCDGIEAVKRVRELEAQSGLNVRLPIVALTADAQESTKQLCLNSGFDTFFPKPLRKPDEKRLLSLPIVAPRPSTADR